MNAHASTPNHFAANVQHLSLVNIGGVGSAETAIQNVTNTDDVRSRLQIALLKKTLDVQKEQAEALLSLVDGKGQVLDIRV